MMKRAALLALIAISAFLLMGCIGPTYEFCCHKEEALGDSPVCYGMNESGEYETLDVVECSEEDWMCTLEETYSEGDKEGENKVVPICPNVKTTPCKTNCSGIFCGNFFYDPRPLPAGYGDRESYQEKESGNFDEDDSVLEKPMGLWQAECRLQNMTPLFLRQVENSGSIVMNKFRFGVGSSFQEFEDAQYYFPLTDKSCFLNPSGGADRYIVYAIPNQLDSGGKLCEQKNPVDGGTVCAGTCPYVCNLQGVEYASLPTIASYSYFDCASRCALRKYGYVPEIEPFNPYLTEYRNNHIGNPFSYGPNTGTVGQSPYPLGASGSTILFPDTYRNAVGELGTNYADTYGYGSTLYGATFGNNKINRNPQEYELLEYIAQPDMKDQLPVPRLFITTPDSLAQKQANLLNFGWSRDYETDPERSVATVFLTLENNPHDFYPWLLAHHSVYNRQFRDGHIIYNGSTGGGAEFECTTGMDCLSGYCNNFDYKRGVCVGLDGKDILCDCWSENGKVTCLGTKDSEVASWDDPAETVEVPVTLSAAVMPTGMSGEDLWTFAELPALGSIKILPFGKGDQTDMPFFVMDLGGGYYDTIDKANKPDYRVRSFAEINSPSKTYDAAEDTMYRIGYLLDPCSAFPEGGFGSWTYTSEGTTYVYCCDGTTSCAQADSKTVVRSYSSYFGSAGKLATRFLQNCLVGNAEDGHPYRADAYLCYSQNAHDRATGQWEWGGFWGGSPLIDEETDKGEEWATVLCRDIGYTSTDKADKFHIGLGDETPQSLRCYLWESGGHTRVGTEDECVLESDSMLVIAPTWHKDIGRWSIGRCLLNENGDDLEIKEYGVCESCGYLTMAKQEITALPEEADSTLDVAAYNAEEMEHESGMYGNTYCPDMVVHTPHNGFSLWQNALLLQSGTLSPFGMYSLEPYGMNGYVSYEMGSYAWVIEDGPRGKYVGPKNCEYPNGVQLNDYGEQRDLPFTYPNAFYINRKLESMMKRNIQPVIFATDDGLWIWSLEEPVEIQPPAGGDEFEVGCSTYFPCGGGMECVDGVCESVFESTGDGEGTGATNACEPDECTPCSLEMECPSEMDCVDYFCRPKYTESECACCEDTGDCSGLFVSCVDNQCKEEDISGGGSGGLGAQYTVTTAAEEGPQYTAPPLVHLDIAYSVSQAYPSGETLTLLDPPYSGPNLLEQLYDTRKYLFEGIQKRSNCYEAGKPCVEDVKSEYYYDVYYSAAGSFLANTILNEGAAIIVVENSSKSGPICTDGGCTGGMDAMWDRIAGRSASTRLLCPNCMVSIAVGYGNYETHHAGAFNMQERLKEMSEVFSYVEITYGTDVTAVSKEPIDDFAVDEACSDSMQEGRSCRKDRLAYVDVISLNMALDGYDNYCSISDEEEMFGAIASNMTLLGRTTLKRFGKPILITDFTIDRSGTSGCWDEEKAGRFMEYLGMHSKDLVDSGYIGLIYSQWDAQESIGILESGKSPDYRGEFFGGMYTAARKFAGHSIMTYYTEVPTKDRCECVPCASSDKQSLCNGQYKGTGPLCDGYAQGQPVKWPDNCITEDVCDTPAPQPIVCTAAYDNGTTRTLTFQLGDVTLSPSAYRDVIASLKSATLCFRLGNKTVTYQKSEQHSFTSLPAVFSMDGNPDVECNPTAGLADSFCGYYPPIAKYQMSCSFSGVSGGTVGTGGGGGQAPGAQSGSGTGGGTGGTGGGGTGGTQSQAGGTGGAGSTGEAGTACPEGCSCSPDGSIVC